MQHSICLIPSELRVAARILHTFAAHHYCYQLHSFANYFAGEWFRNYKLEYFNVCSSRIRMRFACWQALSTIRHTIWGKLAFIFFIYIYTFLNSRFHESPQRLSKTGTISPKAHLNIDRTKNYDDAMFVNSRYLFTVYRFVYSIWLCKFCPAVPNNFFFFSCG